LAFGPLQVASVVCGLALSWPLAVLAWSLPEHRFRAQSWRRASKALQAFSLLLPPLIAVWAAMTVPTVALPGMLVLGWTLGVLAIIDARTFILPDMLTLPLILAGIVNAILTAWPYAGFDDLLIAAGYSALAALFGFVSMALLAWLFRTIRGREGLGLGDAKLLAAAGAWVGLGAVPTVVLLSALGALVGTVVLHRLLRQAAPIGSTPLPFGPYLAAATWIAALYGPLALR
jgi:leader peptidase (prepilin peptidase) / N-methyltransferase